MKVGNKTTTTLMKTDKYFEKTISNKRTGRVINKDNVPCFFSSEKVRMANAGIKTSNKTGAKAKNEDKEAYPDSAIL